MAEAEREKKKRNSKKRRESLSKIK